MSETIVIPAVLPKGQITPVGLLKGYANDTGTVIGGRHYEAGHAVFLGFRDGEANHKDHLFYGNLHFEIHDEPSEALRDDLEPLLEFADAQSREAQDHTHDEAPTEPVAEPVRADEADHAETIPADDDGDQ